MPRLLRPLVVVGRVPLFYVLLHVAIIQEPPGWPASLPWVYLAWATVVALAYPCYRWYAALKAGRTDAWLSYL